MFNRQRSYICIDLKSYYASVECVRRGLDPLEAKLLVADETRSDQTICLAVSPALKAIGVPARPRLFEAKQAIRNYEAAHHEKVDYIIACPHMADYEQVSADIYGIYLKYAAAEDIHVYSIDEAFIDCTGYLKWYRIGNKFDSKWHTALEEVFHGIAFQLHGMLVEMAGYDFVSYIDAHALDSDVAEVHIEEALVKARLKKRDDR